MSRCAWKTLRTYAEAVLAEERVPGAILAIQTYGDELNWHPPLHSLVSEVAWDREGSASRIGWPDSQVLTELFPHHLLEMLVTQRRLSEEFAQKLRSGHPSGFQVYCGRAVDCEDEKTLERLTAYLLRPSLAGTRLRFDANDGPIEYRTTQGVNRSLDALDWIALVTSHIPNPHEQRVRYDGCYSHASPGKRRKNQAPVGLGTAPSDSQSEEDSEAHHCSRERRRNGARWLQKIYEVDPLVCPPCGNEMHIIAFLEEAEVIRKILQHLNLWERPERSPPPRLFPPMLEAFLATLAPEHVPQIRASTDSVFGDEVPLFTD